MDGHQLAHHMHKEGAYRPGMLCIGKIVWENTCGTCWHPTGTFQYLIPSRTLHKRVKSLILRFTTYGWADCCAHMVPHWSHAGAAVHMRVVNCRLRARTHSYKTEIKSKKQEKETALHFPCTLNKWISWREITELTLVQFLSFSLDRCLRKCLPRVAGKRQQHIFFLANQGYWSNGNLVRVNYKEVWFTTAESILTSLYIHGSSQRKDLGCNVPRFVRSSKSGSGNAWECHKADSCSYNLY